MAEGLPASRWPKMPVRTQRIVLRLPESRDVDAIRKACVHPSTRWGIHVLPRPYRRRHAVEFVKKKRVQFRRRENLALAIVLPESGELVGMIELTIHSARERRAELGYWIAPEHRGRGYGTEAARTMCKLGFGVLGLHRIEARALARNKASIRVLESAGFRHEGLLRSRTRVGNRWWDEIRVARVAIRGSSRSDLR